MIGETTGHYRIEEKLGVGGMGVVYKAEDLRLGRKVALKFLPPGVTADPEARKRFVHEARLASSLDHPNIGTIYEIDEADGRVFIAMALYEGRSLDQLIKDGSISLETAVDLGIQIAEGLSRAHGKGIVHRDVKPSNILVTEDGTAKVIDFGIAKLTDATALTQVGSTLGTVAYMSPEQTRGTALDLRSDIWALGVVLFEMLAGRRPFRGTYEQAVIYSILNEEPDRLSEVVPDVSPALSAIVEKALSKEPDARFQNMQEFAEALAHARQPTPVSTEVQAAPARSAVSIPWRSTAIGSALVLVLLAVGYAVWSVRPGPVEKGPVSIALLPLRSLTDSEGNEDWFTEGITDALVTQLAKIGGMRVATAASSLHFKGSELAPSEIARQLGVRYLVEGTVVRVNSVVKIAARLIDPVKDEYLWAEDFERPFEDILALQGEIARTIAAQIHVELTPLETERLSNRRPVNPDAYEAYLKGQFHWSRVTRQDLDLAEQYFRQAIEIAPDEAIGYAGMAILWAGRAAQGLVWKQEDVREAKAAVLKALEMDSLLAEAHLALAFVLQVGERNMDAAEAQYRKAIELNPSFAQARGYYAQMLSIRLKPDEALAEADRAIELDPLNTLYRNLKAMILNFAHRYEEAEALLLEILKQYPADPLALATQRTSMHLQGRYPEAIEAWKTTYESRGDTAAASALMRGYTRGGYSAALSAVAEVLIERSRTSPVRPWQIGTLYARAGRNEEALYWLEKAYEQPEANIPYMNVDPIFDGMRADPRFQAMLKQMGLGD